MLINFKISKRMTKNKFMNARTNNQISTRCESNMQPSDLESDPPPLLPKSMNRKKA